MEMQQLSGKSGEVIKKLKGKERIFSRQDTRQLMKMADLANDENGLRKLGEAVYKMIKKQDATPPEFI